MENRESPYQNHLFICTNEKKGKSCCAQKGSKELREKVKDLVKEPWGKKIRVNSSGCLGLCSKGIVAALYPEGEWFTHLKKGDHKALVKVIDQLESFS